MNRALFGLIALLTLGGCAAAGVEVKPSQMASFQKGVTTEAEVIQALGQPTSQMQMFDGSQTLIYSYASAQARPASFIPIVGMFAGGMDTRHTMAMLRFDASGHLIDTMSSSGGIGSASGFASPTTPTQPGPVKQP